MPSKNKSVIDNWNLSLCQSKIEKLNSTDICIYKYYYNPLIKVPQYFKLTFIIAYTISNNLIDTFLYLFLP